MEKNFNDLGISPPILKAIEEMGFVKPTEVQSRVIPHILNQEDLIVMSKTGSGKTAVFGIPLLQMTDPNALGPQALILTPTRELAVQIDNDLKQMSAHLTHQTVAVYGQHSMNIEIQALKKDASIVTGTPGRVFDHIRHGNLKVKQIRYLVLDEADRMLDMGFIDQVFKIVKTLPRNRVTLLFSATIPTEIQRLCQGYMKNPVTIEIESQTKTVDTIRQTYYRMNKNEKRMQLYNMLMLERPESCLIFCNTRYAVDHVQSFLSSKGYASQAIHGDIPQGKRLSIMQQFKQGDFHILIATDVAARGIHIDDLALVINYDVPLEKDNYVHRIGRTGRAGKGGRAITFVTGDDLMSLYEIEEHTGAMISESELPSDAEVNASRTDAENWIKEKYQSSVLSKLPASKEEPRPSARLGAAQDRNRNRPAREAGRPTENRDRAPREHTDQRPPRPRPESSQRPQEKPQTSAGPQAPRSTTASEKHITTPSEKHSTRGSETRPQEARTPNIPAAKKTEKSSSILARVLNRFFT